MKRLPWILRARKTLSARALCLGFVLGVCAVPSAADAHLVTSGVGPFYDGAVHFFVSPGDLVVVIALALFGGLSGRRTAKFLVIALPLAWLAGAILGHRAGVPEAPAFLQAVGILITGLLVAVNPKVPGFLPPALAVVLGLMHGFMNGRATFLSNTAFLAAIGITAALGLVVLLLAALAASLNGGWQKTTARVLGSWAAAIGLLSLAWSLRPGA